ncbi:unnamed protein product [Rotaria sordida]|uniref:Ty3 transposon capsid-like protein domain-containing protein n=1 Tax=Rotaria sordida TaxID=392033 RepID=A0A819P4Y2_9BILA|nr:unnamed protein product [Rotaria sordida]CAF1433508.1 unnamed protein product [Rotaria sordida]CAF4004469.1 unnamed protein product [Rotaria sordida]CAF4035051.1 unnamed protein product [Rotaria sordida]
MMSQDHITCISKSLSLDSLSTQPTTDTSFLTSTRDQQKSLKISKDNKRRKAILPTPHKPKQEYNLLVMNSKKGLNSQEQNITLKDNRSQSYDKDTAQLENNNKCMKTSNKFSQIDSNCEIASSVVDNTDRQNRVRDVTVVFDQQKNDDKNNKINISNRLTKTFEDNESESQLQPDEDMNYDSFDSFIIQNFVPFSGTQNVIQWLDETEHKFNYFHIGRNLRFEAISLLVEGDAKRKYLKVRKQIQSFDDFYEFLLLKFDSTDHISFQPKTSKIVENTSCDPPASYQTKFTNESNQLVSNTSKSLTSTHHLPMFSSTAVDNFGVTNVIGEKPAIKSTTVSDSVSTSIFDQTLNDLRKAIVGNLIKNPKTFKGGKDDVSKWIEEIEHLLDLAHIPEATRLDLISYSLRGDALEWFKNNRSSLTSWSVFVYELKRAFTSSFHEELAFKKLESYSQGQNQSIHSFFNEVLKLCKEADSTMSEATKLKNLLNKTKPSIQFEVRKKKPTSTAQFLEYAKEAEELMQLSNMTIDNSGNQSSIQVVQQQPISSSTSNPPSSINQAFTNASNNYLSNYPRDVDRNYRFSNDRNINSNSKFPSFSSSKTSQSKVRFNNNFSRPYRPSYSNNSANKNYQKFRPPQNTSSSNTYSRTRTANTIDLVSPSANIEPLHETLSSSTCSRCSQFGHEASACPSF